MRLAIMAADLRAGDPVRDAIVAGERAPAEWSGWTLGYAVRRLRIRFGLNQKQMAYLAGVPPSVLCRVEREQDVRLSSLRKIFAAVGCRAVILPSGGSATLDAEKIARSAILPSPGKVKSPDTQSPPEPLEGLS